MITTYPFRDLKIRILKNPKAASSYLDVVAEENDFEYLIEAIRDVVEAQGGIGTLAKKTGLSRTSLYKTLSPTGNPEFSTVKTILAAYGVRISYRPAAKT